MNALCRISSGSTRGAISSRRRCRACGATSRGFPRGLFERSRELILLSGYGVSWGRLRARTTGEYATHFLLFNRRGADCVTGGCVKRSAPGSFGVRRLVAALLTASKAATRRRTPNFQGTVAKCLGERQEISYPNVLILAPRDEPPSRGARGLLSSAARLSADTPSKDFSSDRIIISEHNQNLLFLGG